MKHRQPTFWLCALVLAALIGAAGTFQARGFHPGTNVASNTAPIVGIAVENGHGLHNAHPATQVEFNTGIAVTNTSDNCVTTCVRNVRMNGNAIPGVFLNGGSLFSLAGLNTGPTQSRFTTNLLFPFVTDLAIPATAQPRQTSNPANASQSMRSIIRRINVLSTTNPPIAQGITADQDNDQAGALHVPQNFRSSVSAAITIQSVGMTQSAADFTVMPAAPGFRGYMMAPSQTQYVHGSAFIARGLGDVRLVAVNYLVLVVPWKGGAAPLAG